MNFNISAIINAALPVYLPYKLWLALEDAQRAHRGAVLASYRGLLPKSRKRAHRGAQQRGKKHA